MWTLIAEIFIAGFFIADIGFFIADNYAGAYITLGIALVLAYFFGPGVADTIQAQGWMYGILHYGLYYLGTGAVVALVKWILFNAKVISRIREARDHFTEHNSEKDLQDYFNRAKNGQDQGHGRPDTYEGFRRWRFLNYWDSNTRYKNLPSASLSMYTQAEDADIIAKKLTPRAMEYIAEITFWILQWPVVIIATVIQDFIGRLGRHLARLMDVLFVGPVRQFVRAAAKGL